MSTEAIGIYSRDTVYGQLTYPFLNGGVRINAHTPYDKEDSTQASAVSMKDFVKTPTKARIFSIDDYNEISALGNSSDLIHKTGVLKKQSETEFPPKLVSSFSRSELSSTDIVYNALNNGYNTNEALAIAKAQKAYSTSYTNVTANPVKVLLAHSSV